MTADRKTILIVDDTPENIDVLSAVLKNDYNRKAAVNGPKALQIAASDDRPDLILLDIMMPEMDGYEVCKRLKADPKTAGIPVIFVTAKTEVEDETRGFELGAVDYITKPVSPPVVLARVRTQLALKAANDELRRRNQELVEYNRLREEVERITRHDLKTPLQAVITAPALLADEGNLTDNQVEVLQMVEESGYRMLEIINSSLDLYKMETGTYKLHPTAVDLVGLVEQIRGETRDLLAKNDLKIKVVGDKQPGTETGPVLAAGEEMLCYSLLANLIKNAVEASPLKGQVTIAFESGKDGRVIVLIHNQGLAPPDVQDRFFEKYVTSGKKGGTGLGTYSAKLIAETLGGGISFVSTPEKGTLVTVELPPAAEAAAPKRPEPMKGLPGRLSPSVGVLIVDDYASMRRITKNSLRQIGFTDFHEAENGREAAAVLENQDIGLVITDLNMPVMDGLELLRHIRGPAGLTDLPVIVISGEASQETILEAAKTGVSDFLLKPYTPDRLQKKIEDLFGT